MPEDICSGSSFESFVDCWTSAGFDKCRDQLRSMVLPAVQFHPQLCDDQTIPKGKTKLGGKPDLRKSDLWPRTKEGRWLGFLAQINLSEMAQYALDGDVPTEGLLSFFYDAELGENMPWGNSPEEADGWRVIYEPEATAVDRIDFPKQLSPAARFGSAVLLPTPRWTMPFPETACVRRRLDLNEDERRRFRQLCSESWCSEDPCIFFGHPSPVQGDMDFHCQCAFHGLKNYDHDPRFPELEAGIEDWRHIFALPSYPQLGLNWTGEGILYYWIRKADLRNRDFRNAWLILETT